MKSNNFYIGLLMCLLAVVSWGAMFPVMGSALKTIDPFYFTLFRFIIALIVLTFILVIVEGKKKLKSDGKTMKLWFFGTMGITGFGFLVFLGQQLAGSSGAVIAAVIMAIQPLLGALVNWVSNGQKPKPITLLFMLLGLIGVIMVISKGDLSVFISDDGNVFAYIFILLGALCFVIYTMGGGFFPDWSPLRYTTITTITGTISNLVLVGTATLMGWLTLPTVAMIGNVRGELMYMALVAGVLGFFVWNSCYCPYCICISRLSRCSVRVMGNIDNDFRSGWK